MTMPLKLSAIIPAYNEINRLPGYLTQVVDYLERQSLSFEVIIVDDGSTDGTGAMVERFREENANVRLIRLRQNRGKGHAVKTGMLEASGQLRLFADADGATPIAELQQLVRAIEGGADVAVASRALRADTCTVQTRLSRKVIGTLYNFIVRMLAVRGIKDTQCGFKLFSAESAATVFPLQRIEDFGFDVELLFICRKKGYRIVEVPVNWTDVRGTKVKVLRDSVRMFYDVLKIRLNDLRGMYRG